MITDEQVIDRLENIYISPLESCNLSCLRCYTKKTPERLTNQEIIDFIERYRKEVNLKSIVFCGGEAFLLPDFTQLINLLHGLGIFTTIITNGTIDKLEEIDNPNSCQLLVSLDGLPETHDKNRGKGIFVKCITFINKALGLGFAVEIMYLVSKESVSEIDTFAAIIYTMVGEQIPVTYITDKASFYRIDHPMTLASTDIGLSPEQIMTIKRKYPSVPPTNFGCYQLALQSNKMVYPCCEARKPIGDINTPIGELIVNFKSTLNRCRHCTLNCLGCCEPKFLCGYVKELGFKRCNGVHQLFCHSR